MSSRMKIAVLVVFGFVSGAALGSWGTEYFIRYQSEHYGADMAYMGAVLAKDDEDYDTATGYAYMALGINPNWYAPYAVLGEIFTQTGKIDAALVMYRIGIEKTSYASDTNIFGIRAEDAEIERNAFLKKIEELIEIQNK